MGNIKKLRMGDMRIGKNHLGQANYHAFLFLFQASKSDIIDIVSKQDAKAGALFKKISEELSLFDMITLFPMTTSSLEAALGAFLEEEVGYVESERAIITYRDMGTGSPIIVGRVTRDNYDELRDAIMKTNHAQIDLKKDVPLKADNDEVLKKWQEAEKMNQDLQEKTDTDDCTFGNMISKLCSAGIGIDFRNVWDLTIFQAINYFQELGYLHGVHLSERVFSIHGGDNFNMNDWMKNIYSANSKKG